MDKQTEQNERRCCSGGTAIKQGRQNDCFYRTLAEDMPGLICRFLADGTITYANGAYCRYFNKMPDELIGTSFLPLIPEEDREGVMANIASLSSQHPVQSHEHQVIAANGDIRYHRWTNRVICDRDGRIACYQAVGEDITEQKKLAKRLRQAEKMEAIGQLAGGIAHDFNNVLGIIIGFTELSLNLTANESILKGNLNNIMKAGERAKQLVRQIMAFSRPDNDCMKPVMVDAVANEAVSLLRGSLPTSVIINAKIEKQTVPVMATAAKIEEIIINLCTNANHAMNGKGALCIKCFETHYDEEIDGVLGKSKPGFYSIISVIDSGCGIPDTDTTKIFNPFFTTKSIDVGTGMGLAVVFGITKSHGGNIVVESKVGVGTAFHVFLPKTDVKLVVDAEALGQTPGGSETIMLVDDELLLCECSKIMLSKLGYKVCAYNDSIQAMEMYSKNPEAFDLVIVDQTMPELTGLDLTSKILAIRPNQPVILCTGFSQCVNKEQAFKAGVKGFIMKPFTKEMVAAEIRRALDCNVVAS